MRSGLPISKAKVKLTLDILFDTSKFTLCSLLHTKQLYVMCLVNSYELLTC